MWRKFVGLLVIATTVLWLAVGISWIVSQSRFSSWWFRRASGDLTHWDIFASSQDGQLFLRIDRNIQKDRDTRSQGGVAMKGFYFVWIFDRTDGRHFQMRVDHFIVMLVVTPIPLLWLAVAVRSCQRRLAVVQCDDSGSGNG